MCVSETWLCPSVSIIKRNLEDVIDTTVPEAIQGDDTSRGKVRRQHVEFSNLEPLCTVTPDLHHPTHRVEPKNGSLYPHRPIEGIRGMVEMSQGDASCCDCVSEMGFGCSCGMLGEISRSFSSAVVFSWCVPVWRSVFSE